jgi:outer membrane PBP1 activator LpoA protein
MPSQTTKSAPAGAQTNSIGIDFNQARQTLTQRDRDLKLTLAKAQALLNSGEPAQTLILLDEFTNQEFSASVSDRLYTFMAQAHFSLNNAIEAYRALTQVSQTTAEYWFLLQRVCSALVFNRCKADSMIALQSQTQLFDQVEQDAILEALLEANRNPGYEDLVLNAAQITPLSTPENTRHLGWYALTDILTSAGSRQKAAAAWDNWQLRWSTHPAALTAPTLTDQLAVKPTQSISLMLPLSGNLARVGRAVRDGFIAALMAEELNTDLHIFDSATHSPIELIRLARNVSADVLVGPLLKLNVDAFAAFAAASETPTLLLNYLPSDEDIGAPAINLLQLGTAIEDEAATLAAHMQTNQHERVMVVYNNSAWANKALNTFRKAWPYPVHTANFSTIKQLTNAVGSTMGVAASTARKTRIAALLDEPVEFLPRARQDLDAILALTTGFESAALVPALQFHFADHLPVYATSQSLRDNKSPTGFAATELPALVQPDVAEQALIDAFNLNQSPLVDLYALGLAAFQMATWAPVLTESSSWREHFIRHSPIGTLRIGSTGRLSRTLTVTTVSDQQSERSSAGIIGSE